MKCTLCGFVFDETEAKSGCKGCALAKGCARLKCPNCGFEAIPEPKWLQKLRKRRNRDVVE